MMSWEELHDLLDIHGSDEGLIEPRYNIAPGTDIHAGYAKGDGRTLTTMRWGVEAEWAKSTLINAQSEKYANTSRSFWSTFKRCAIPASSFYEWKAIPGQRTKQPMYIRSKGSPCLFAGLYRTDRDRESQNQDRCVILTTRPNELMTDIHRRMPAMLRMEDRNAWLDPTIDRTELANVLEPFPSEMMEAFPVSKAVNNVANDIPDLIHPNILNPG